MKKNVIKKFYEKECYEKKCYGYIAICSNVHNIFKLIFLL